MPSTTYAHGVNAYNHHKCRCDICKAAKAEHSRAYYQANKEKVKARTLAYGRANPEKRRAYNKEQRARNGDARAAYAKVYREANKEKLAELNRAWQKANAHKIVERNQIRRAQKLENGVFVILPGEWNRVLERHRHECFYCGGHHRDSPLTIDHIIPLAKGGRHAIGNLIPACQPCNSSKHARLLVEWKHRG